MLLLLFPIVVLIFGMRYAFWDVEIDESKLPEGMSLEQGQKRNKKFGYIFTTAGAIMLILHLVIF